MLPSWRLALNTIAGKPGRTALMISAVALAVSLVVAVSCAIASMQEAMTAGLVKILGAADARVIHPGNGRFDEALLEMVRSWPEVDAASGRLASSIVLVHADGRRDPQTGELRRSVPSAYGVEFNVDQRFRTLDLLDGRRPHAPDEILLDVRTAQELRAEVGDVLAVQRFGEPVTLKVAGIYQRELLGAVQRPLIEIDRRTLAQAADKQGQLTSIWIILKPDEDVGGFCARHQSELPEQLALEPSEMIRSGFDRQILANRFGLTIASMLTFMSASFIIVTALTTSVSERQREMAVTRCIGASRSQLFLSQLMAGLIFSSAGVIAGVPLGMGLAGLLVVYFGEFMSAGLRLHGLGLGLAIAGAMAAGLLGAAYPALMASRVSPLQAMAVHAKPVRPVALLLCMLLGMTLIGVQLALFLIADSDLRFYAYTYAGLPALYLGYFVLAVPLAAMLALSLSRPLGAVLRLPGGMLSRSLLTTPFRHGFTAGALMVGISILVSTWANMTSLMDDWIGKMKFADGFVFLTTGISPAQQQAIARLPFVHEVCPISYLPVRVYDRQIFGVQGLSPPNVTLVGFDPEVFFRINAVEWSAGEPHSALAKLKDGRGVIVADRFLTTQKVKIGEKLKLGVGRAQKEFEIVGAVNSAGLDIATQLLGIRSQYMEFSISMVFVDFSVVREVFDNHDVIAMQLNFDKSLSDEEISRQIAEVAPGVQFKSGRFMVETINEIAGFILTIDSTVAFAALVLACLGMGNVIVANIHGRRYEYGVLRAVGAHRIVLARLIFAEVAIIAITGALAGTILGLHLAWVGARHYRDLAGLPVRLVVPYVPTMIGWGVLLVMSLLAALPGVLSVIRKQPAALLAAGRGG